MVEITWLASIKTQVVVASGLAAGVDLFQSCIIRKSSFFLLFVFSSWIGQDVQRKLIEIRERGWFFRLSHFETALLDMCSSRPELIQPPAYLDEVLEQLNDLQDIPVTRDGTDWGIPPQFDSRQRIYVWFDALASYLTGAGTGAPIQVERV